MLNLFPGSESQTDSVLLYVSDGEQNLVAEDSIVPKQRKAKKWHLKEEFADRETAMKFIREEGHWSVRYTHRTSEGKKVFYRCTRVKKSDAACAAGLYLLYVNSSLKVELYSTKAEHTCNNSCLRGLSEKAKLEIKKFIDLGVKPKKMVEMLHDGGFKEIKRTQVYSFVFKTRKERLGPATISLGDLEAWCIVSGVRPRTADEAFVFAHDFAENDGNDEVCFKLSISTPRLLEHARNAGHLAIDATYKLNWQGYPVLIVGTTDLDRHFHPLCLSICSNEQRESFEFILESLKKEVPELSPTHLISDASQAIREAFRRVFGPDCSVLMCWAHAFRNISKHSHLIKGSKSDILDGIRVLQVSPDAETFAEGVKLFIKKYKDSEREFIDYMNKIWFTTHSTWFEGAADRLPSTNNGLESFNNVIKREETLRERMPVGQFSNQCLISVSRWSKQYGMDKKIASKPTLNLEDWTYAYQWAKSPKKVRSKGFGDLTEYFCPAGKTVTLSEADVRRARKRSWRSFDDFRSHASAAWIVTMRNEEWVDARCSCPRFLKNYKCKHSLGMAIRLQLVNAPPEAKQIPLGQKRKPGRPKKASQALLID